MLQWVYALWMRVLTTLLLWHIEWLRLEKEPRLPLRKIKERLQQHQRNNCCLNEEQKYIHKAWLQVGGFLHSKQAAKAKLTQH